MRSLLRRFLTDEFLARSVLGTPVEDWLLLVGALVATARLRRRGASSATARPV